MPEHDSGGTSRNSSCRSGRSSNLVSRSRREAQRKYDLSATLIRFRLTQSDRGELAGYEAKASVLGG